MMRSIVRSLVLRLSSCRRYRSPAISRLRERGLVSRVKRGQTRRRMRELGLRSPSVKVGGIVYFGRLIDKIRQHAKGQLPSDYQANLGRGFDSSCTKFLRIDHNRLMDRVKEGGSDEEILQWCF